MPASNAGSFSAYLEYAQRKSTDDAARTSSPASLLGVLNGQAQKSMPLSQLTDLSGMSAAQFRDALKKLADSSFIDISGQPLSEEVTLTPKGLEAAALL
jgi:predicted transcriptional regulator